MFCEEGELPFLNSWLRSSFVPRLDAEPARDARLALVVDVPGEPELDRQARSLALQFRLPSMQDYQKWVSERLDPALADLTRRFGEKVLTFRTVLEELPL